MQKTNRSASATSCAGPGLALITICSLALPVTVPAQAAAEAAASSVGPMTIHGGFIENRGQWPEPVRFQARRGPATAWLTDDGWTIALHSPGADSGAGPTDRPESPAASVMQGVSIRMSFSGMPSAPQGEMLATGVHHFLHGDDPSKWAEGARGYARVRYRSTTAGVDVVVRLDDAVLRYDLELAAGASLDSVQVDCAGCEGLRVDHHGRLVMDTALGPVFHSAPVSWHVAHDGTRIPARVAFRILDHDSFGFTLHGPRLALPLVVDPGISWGSYLGGAVFDAMLGLDRSSGGRLFVCGYTDSLMFPTTPGVFQSVLSGRYDAVVACLDPQAPAGQQLVWSTMYGGSGEDWAVDVVAEPLGRWVTVVGRTDSAALPLQNPAQGNFGGGSDGFVARLNATGTTLLYATYLGGPDYDRIQEIAEDAAGNIAFAGYGGSALPTTGNAYQPLFAGGGNPPFDAFAGWLDPSATPGFQISYLTYLGGSGIEGGPGTGANGSGPLNLRGMGLVIEGPRLILTGGTWSSGFPRTGGAPYSGSKDPFVAAIDPTRPAAQQLVFSYLVGGTDNDGPTCLSKHPAGGYVAGGYSNSGSSFPVTAGAFSSTGRPVMFWLDPALPWPQALRYSTRLGAGMLNEGITDLQVETSGKVIFGGWFRSQLGTPGAYQPQGPSASMAVGGVGRMALTSAGASDLEYFTYLGNQPTAVVDLVATPGGGVIAAGFTRDSLLPFGNGPQPLYGGGYYDGMVVQLDFLPAGTAVGGASAPACSGLPIYCAVNSQPAPGNRSFAVSAANAPPGSLGALFFGIAAQPPMPLFNVLAHLQISPTPIGITGFANNLGYAEINVPIPSNVAVPTGFSLQWLFVNTLPCSNGGPFSASERLDL